MSDLLNSASLVMIPSGYKEDKVYSAVPADGSGDLSFTRASNGTRVNSAGLVEVTPWNLLQYSEIFTNAIWTANSNTITENTTTAPNGTTTADTFTLVAGADASVYQAVNGVSNNYTTSVYAKYVSGDKYLYFFSQLNSQGAKVWFDIQNGTVSNQLSGFTGTIENAGNGWYKCSIYNSTASDSTYIQFGISTTNSSRVLSNNSVAYFWGAQVNLGTAKPYFPTTDRLNVPRLTYQNGGGGCPSLLLEKQSTNLFTYSEQFDQSSWTKQNSSVTANATTSPDGTTNADKFIASNANAFHAMYGLNSVLTGNHTISVYAKKGEYDFIVLHDQFSSTFNAAFNLNTGAVVSGSGASIENIGDGWYRCIVGFNGGGNTVIASLSPSPTSGAGTNYQGDGTSGVFIWGAQIEASSYATSLINTTSASATRVADVCVKTGITSLIGQSEGTMFCEFNAIGSYDANNMLCTLSDGTGNNRIFLNLTDGVGNLESVITTSGSLVSLYVGTPPSVGRHKIAIAYKSNDVVVYLDGVLLFTDTSVSIPATSKLNIGSYFNETFPFNSGINQSALFPTRLTNAELASLTTL